MKNDTINRKDAIDELREYIVDSAISEDEMKLVGYNEGIQTAIATISNMPSVEPAILGINPKFEEFFKYYAEKYGTGVLNLRPLTCENCQEFDCSGCQFKGG